MPVINFDSSQAGTYEGNFDPMPAGWYIMSVESSEIKPNNAQTGAVLVLTYIILDGQHKGRKLFEHLNIQNPNSTAVEIAYKKLNSLRLAVGVTNLQNTEQLHNIPFKGKIKIRPANGQYEASNEVTMWKNVNEPVDGAPAAQSFQPPAAQPFQNPIPANAQPWNQPPQNNAPVQNMAPPSQQPWGQQPQAPQQNGPAPASNAMPPWMPPTQ